MSHSIYAYKYQIAFYRKPIALAFFHYKMLCLSWHCNLSDGEKIMLHVRVSERENIKCFNLQFHVHHYYHQFYDGLYNMWWRFFFFLNVLNWKWIEQKGIFDYTFSLITCLWIINWRILMFLFSLRSSIVARLLWTRAMKSNVQRSTNEIEREQITIMQLTFSLFSQVSSMKSFLCWWLFIAN